MAVVKGAKPNFYERLAGQRRPVAEKPLKAAEPLKKAQALTSRFEGTHVRAATLADHGESLKGALPHLNALAGVADRLPAADANQLHKTLSGFYDSVGQHLELVPEAARSTLATAAVKGMRDLAEQLDGHRAMVPAMSAAAQLVEATPRLVAQGSLTLGPAEHAEAVRSPFGTVQRLVDRLDGREGVGSALTAFVHLTGQLEAATPKLTAPVRADIHRAVADYLVDAAPRNGFDPELTAKLSRLATDALAQQPEKNFQAALKTAKAEFTAQNAPAQKLLLEQLGRVPAGVRPGTPEHAYLTALRRVLAGVVQENPVGTTKLFASLRDFDAAMAEPIRVATNSQDAIPAHQLVEGKYKRVEVPKREAQPPPPHFAPALGHLAELIARHGKTPVAAELLHFAGAHAEALVSPEAGASLRAAAEAKGGGPAAAALLRAVSHSLPAEARTPQFAVAAEALDALNGPEAFRALSAAEPYLKTPQAGPVLHGLVDFLSGHAGAPSADELGRLAERLPQALGIAAGQFPDAGQAREVAVRLAQTKVDLGALGLDAKRLAALVVPARGAAPDAVTDLFFPTVDGRPGLITLADPATRFRNGDPGPYFKELAGAVAKGLENSAAKAELTRYATAFAVALGQMDGDPKGVYKIALPDWTRAVSGKEQLHGQGVLEFLHAHPELPLEVAATAALRLTPEQLTWVSERFSKAKSREQFRTLRNFIFACAANNSLSMLDVVRTSTSTPKVLSATMTSIGLRFRAGEAIEWKEIAAGLKAGGDPVADLAKKKGAAALKALGPVAAVGNAGQEGIKDLQKAAQEIASITQYVQRGEFEAPFTEALKQAAAGNWPEARYTSPVGKRQMAILTPAQQAVWRTRMVTPADGEILETEVLREATPLVAGLAKALPKDLRLGGVQGVELKWDAATAKALIDLRDRTLDKLHKAEKGSDVHRRLGTQMGILSRNLAVIDLKLALSKPTAADELPKLRPVLRNAIGPLRAFGADASVEAAYELLNTADLRARAKAPAMAVIPAKGKVAVDEDGLAALITSHIEGTCLNPINGFNRYGLVVGLTNANYRMLRVLNNGKQLTRSFVEFFQVDIPGHYKGPAVWVDFMNNGGGGTQQDYALAWRHILGKAIKMGVPLLGQHPPDQGQWLGPLAKLVDVLPQQQVTFHVQQGTTQKTHVDNLMYGFQIPAAGLVHNAYAGVIVMPKKKGA